MEWNCGRLCCWHWIYSKTFPLSTTNNRHLAHLEFQIALVQRSINEQTLNPWLDFILQFSFNNTLLFSFLSFYCLLQDLVAEEEDKNWKGICIAILVITSIISCIAIAIFILTPSKYSLRDEQQSFANTWTESIIRWRRSSSQEPEDQFGGYYFGSISTRTFWRIMDIRYESLSLERFISQSQSSELIRRKIMSFWLWIVYYYSCTDIAVCIFVHE